MIKLLVWVLVSYGISNIVVYGKIFDPVRNILQKNIENKYIKFIYEMTECMMCFSTWLGFFLGIFFFSPSHEFLEFHRIYSWFFDGVLASGSVWIINSFVEFLEENRIK